MIQYFSTLTGRFILSALLMYLLMVPLLFFGVFYIVESNYQSNFVNQVRNDAFVFSSFTNSENSLKYHRIIIEDAVSSGRLLSAQIVDENKKTVYTWGAEPALNAQEEDFFFGEHNDNVFNIIVPRFDVNGNQVGAFVLSYDEQSTREQIYQAYYYGIYLTIAYIAITFTLTMLLGRQVTQPIHELREASHEISMGQYKKALNVKTGISDIQQLASTLEFMRHELVKKNSEMQHQAMHDSLTGLPNRLFLRQKIDQIMPENGENEQTIALLLIDLDRFKEINDTLGHLVGDEVLKISAERLQLSVRMSDMAVRLGGDEFAVVLPDINRENAMNIAQKISVRLQEPVLTGEHWLQVGASIGVALYPEHGENFKDIMHCADVAMYASKRKQEGGVTVYCEEIN
ncbi:diguanylate cyclase/phosphodiesterase (GGDEF & EAL domains) with PAS/PAC sensor(s) [hydrothermal vent metagenome]|uniref:Diguanylate cyclase/phosphodiesterase (GGDEF & EAL domains) with PAS/PAC sensor(S) n=1 Tax=hydrothermal vent metagenome TaxID=652676 RepID=A0A3B0XPI5_9ZZZZ